MQYHSATIALRDALTAVPEVVDRQAKDRLRDAVNAFVDTTKAQQWSIERAIVALKLVAAESGWRGSVDVLRTNTPLQLRDELMLDLVRWCVERYYGYVRPSTTFAHAGTGKGLSEER
jgi:hypothetical protein